MLPTREVPPIYTPERSPHVSMATSEKQRTSTSDTKGSEADRVQTTWGNEMGIVQRQRLKQCFELFDVNKDGKISAAELTTLLTKMGNRDTRTITEKDAQQVRTTPWPCMSHWVGDARVSALHKLSSLPLDPTTSPLLSLCIYVSCANCS